MSAKKNPRSRWVRGNDRFNEETLHTIARKYREEHGWAQGARVQRRKK